MNKNALTDEQIDTTIRTLLDNRTEVARNAAHRFRDLKAAQDALTEAQQNYADAFNAALKGGWNTTELTTQLGLTSPEAKPRRRRPAKKDTVQHEHHES